jgi:hypothetical protein
MDKKRLKELKKRFGRNFHHIYNVQSEELIHRIFEVFKNPALPMWNQGEFKMESFGYGKVPNQMGFMLRGPSGPAAPMEITFVQVEDGYEVFFKLVFPPEIPKMIAKMAEKMALKLFDKKYMPAFITEMNKVHEHMLQFPTATSPAPEPAPEPTNTENQVNKYKLDFS